MATWRSGDASDCKSAYPGSIPGVASTLYPFGAQFSLPVLRRHGAARLEFRFRPMTL